MYANTSGLFHCVTFLRDTYTQKKKKKPIFKRVKYRACSFIHFLKQLKTLSLSKRDSECASIVRFSAINSEVAK